MDHLRVASALLQTDFPFCSIADCEYRAQLGSDKCYCHSRGFKPPISYARYQQLSAEELVMYLEWLMELEGAAKRGEGLACQSLLDSHTEKHQLAGVG